MVFLARCLNDGVLHAFYLLDAHMHLGIDRGPPVRSYDYGNFFKFCQSVEKTFFKDLSQASSGLNYRLEGLRTPEEMVGFPLPLTAEKTSMLFDEFFASPYMSKIASISTDHLKVNSDDVEASRNNKLIMKWSASHSLIRFNTFKYVIPSNEISLEDEIETALSSEGFFGVKIKFDVLKDSFVNVLKVMQSKNSPLIIEVLPSEKLETFYNLLDSALSKIGDILPPIILNSFGYDSDTDLLWKALSIGNVYADLSALDFNHLVEFIVSAKEKVPNWSKKLLFGTNYPFCKIGDVVRALKYLFGSDFVGDSTDLKRILGGNAVGLVPPHHNLLTSSVEETCTLAIDKYSRQVGKIFEELLSYFIKRGLITVSSCDFLVKSDEGVIDLSKYFLALRSTKENSRGVTFLFMKTPGNVPRDALAIAVLNPKALNTIRNRTIENLSANKTFKDLLSQASLISAEDDINKVSKMIIDALFKTKTIERDEVSVFSLSAAPLKEKGVGMNPKDMKILDIKDDDIILIKPTATEAWYAALVKSSEDASPGEVLVNEEIMSNWYVFEGDTARIESYTGKIELLEQVGFAVESSEGIKLFDLLEKIKDKMDLLYEKLDGFFVGKGMKFILPELFLDFPFIIKPIHSQPGLENKKLGIIKTGKTVINFVSEQWVKPYNLILVINTSEITKNSDINVEGFKKFADLLSLIDTQLVEKFEKKIKEGKITKNIAAALIGISCLKNLSEKSNLNKASVISYSNQSNLFTILERGKVNPYINFRTDRREFSLKVLSSHISDKCQYPEGKANLKEAGAKLQEFIEKVGDQIPTLTLIITPGEKTENLEIFQEMADKDTRIKLVVIQIGKTENENELKRIISSVKGKYLPIEKIDPKTLGMELVSQLTELL